VSQLPNQPLPSQPLPLLPKDSRGILKTAINGNVACQGLSVSDIRRSRPFCGNGGSPFFERTAGRVVQREVMKMGKIKEFIEKTFDDYRNDRITLKQLIISLSRYAERNIPYDWLWAIFEDELNKQFNDIGDIAY
jgi:hypothetical protein